MTYYIGSEVKIKSWAMMKKEFGVHNFGHIMCQEGFTRKQEEWLKENAPNRIVKIKTCIMNNMNMGHGNFEEQSYYTVSTGSGALWAWSDDMIECLASEVKPVIRVSRFELMEMDE